MAFWSANLLGTVRRACIRPGNKVQMAANMWANGDVSQLVTLGSSLNLEAWMQKAVSYARSQMALNGASQEKIAGANEFIEILTQLPVEEQPPKDAPDKSALPSYG